MEKVLKCLRPFIIVFFIFTMWYDINYVGLKFDPELEQMQLFMAGRLIFITVWNMIATVLYHSIAMLNDMFGTNDNASLNPPIIRKIRDYFFAGLVFPASMFVGLSFWALYAINPEYIFPKEAEALFPSWINHTMHTLVVFLVIFELLASCRHYPKRSHAVTGLLLGGVIYMTVMHIVKFYYGLWPYKILENFNFIVRIIVLAVFICWGVLLFFIGEFINNKFWKHELKMEIQMKNRIKKN